MLTPERCDRLAGRIVLELVRRRMTEEERRAKRRALREVRRLRRVGFKVRV